MKGASDKPEQKACKPDELPKVPAKADEERPAEFGGPRGLEPTRYGDWERKGRCIDF